VDDPAILAGIFREAPTPVAVHCEDTPTIRANERIWRARHGDDVPMGQHPVIRGREACLKSSTLAVALAREHGTRLHVLHLTSAEELALFAPGPVEGKRITAEACVHHLWFTDADYARLGGLIKCNPALKTAADRDALRQALAEGRIDVVATDHAPHTREEKAHPYFGCPSGLPLIQYLLPALYELHRQGVFPLEGLVEKACHNPARLFGVQERGFIREDWWADLVLLDPATPVTAADDRVLSKCGWTPFAGTTFSASVDTTIVSGRIAWRRGTIDEGVRGRRLAFAAERR